jgi:hypothetical protein
MNIVQKVAPKRVPSWILVKSIRNIIKHLSVRWSHSAMDNKTHNSVAPVQAKNSMNRSSDIGGIALAKADNATFPLKIREGFKEGGSIGEWVEYTVIGIVNIAIEDGGREDGSGRKLHAGRKGSNRLFNVGLDVGENLCHLRRGLDDKANLDS